MKRHPPAFQQQFAPQRDHACPESANMQDIDELICRSLKGRTSREEERRLEEWKNAAPRNHAYYSELIRLLSAVAAVAERDDALHRPVAADVIRLASHAGSGAKRQLRGAARTRWAPLLTAAAALAVAVAGLYLATRPHPPAFRMGTGEYVSGPNETTTATLADGTVVRLAPNSRLRIFDRPGRREVFLAGHAFLAVAHMADLPFRLRTSLGDIQILGTRLDVLAGDELRVVVVQGKVALSNGRDRVEIPAGQMSMVTDGALLQPVKIDVRPLVAWVGRFIAFQETPLREVARELEQEYGASVVLKDSSMADLTVTGWYIDRTFEEIVVIVCGVLGVDCSIENGTATIGR